MAQKLSYLRRRLSLGRYFQDWGFPPTIGSVHCFLFPFINGISHKRYPRSQRRPQAPSKEKTPDCSRNAISSNRLSNRNYPRRRDANLHLLKFQLLLLRDRSYFFPPPTKLQPPNKEYNHPGCSLGSGDLCSPRLCRSVCPPHPNFSLGSPLGNWSLLASSFWKKEI